MDDRFRPLAEQHRGNDEAKFQKYAALAIECARLLTPYQSPTFRAVIVTPPLEAPRTRKFTPTIFDRHNGARELAGVDDEVER